ncbi:NAD(P)-dependent dehydrogenase (short-subunit alcohol dehydrogenase family) [Bacillus niacini]|uniref:NAD(P)-dependent dehydrogenase (Short-subunit alcohol dehydrogenase family) n=1 Tax=Neobacillus niacini TaxID=86668 RepID=A0A852TDW1_9BACI|nr:hypothetical protein [Neobacillus niacini]NYE05464.1 NAD(P)-dependent dehydrogenase (short-subunit alcohol dehydrogenase family) [Neobacillus niacini]
MNSINLFRLQGKTAIITGRGRGLGEQIAEAYADTGANEVVLLIAVKVQAINEKNAHSN